MSSANPVGIPVPQAVPQIVGQHQHTQGDVRRAIARAAEQTGVDFDYLIGQAKLESSMDPSARARTSSAAGLYQFINNTWLETMDRHGERLGFGSVADAIEMQGGRPHVTDPAQRDAIMALRFDPQAASLMAGALASDNREALRPVLGREAEPAELYLAHFLGAKGAGDFLTALQQTPDAAAASLFPRAASANRAIFYGSGGAQRSVRDVMSLFEHKIGAAMEGASPAGLAQPGFGFDQPFGRAASFGPPPFTTARPAGPLGQVARAVYSQTLPGSRASLPAMPQLPAHAPRASMAEVVRGSFGDGTGFSAEAQSRINRAYSKLEAFGL